MTDNSSIIEGTVKFRDGKKWKSRWCVMRKLSPVADCLHLQLYRDSKDRYKHGQTKASLSLQHFLGIESGFTLDKESNTIAILCQDVIVVLAFDTRERLIQWQVKISTNLGDDQQFLVLVSSAPPKTKVASGPARMHVQDHRFCLTTGVPPRLAGCWEIAHLRRYGVVEGRFCFEGGSRCGKGEGLFVLVTDQGEEITNTLKLASQGKLAAKRRPLSRKISAMDSPRKLSSRLEARISDLSCVESFLNPSSTLEINRSLCDESFCHQTAELTPCTCRTSSPFWSTESTVHNHADLDSNYGCGDTASVSELHDLVHDGWTGEGASRVPASLERCMSCISKLGAPSMSRSSTATVSGTPGAAPLFSPAWTMESTQNHQPQVPAQLPQTLNRNAFAGSDRMSLCSHGSSSGNSEYSVPRQSFLQEVPWYERAQPTGPQPLPPKSPKITAMAQQQQQCQCSAPARPPKPVSLTSPSSKKAKKPPMPLPIAAPLKPACSCQGDRNSQVGPYDNYDVPKIPLLVEKKPDERKLIVNEHYDTPKKIKECITAEIVGNSLSTINVRKPCGCILKFNKPVLTAEAKIENDDPRLSDCPCQRVMCWGSWMTLPYCRRSIAAEATEQIKVDENLAPAIKVNCDAIYATVDMSKKTSRRTAVTPQDPPGEESGFTNYVNIEPEKVDKCPEAHSSSSTGENYANIDFAHSLEHYENAKVLLQKAGITRAEMEAIEAEDKVSFSINNGHKVCNKCGHGENAACSDDDYLLMDPGNCLESCHGKSSPELSAGKNHPGYIPMSPATGSLSKGDYLKHRVNKLMGEKSASNPSLIGPMVDRSRKRSDSDLRIPGSAMLMIHHPGNSPYIRRQLMDSSDSLDTAKKWMVRKRSSSADSTRYLDDDFDTSRTTTPSSETLRKGSTSSLGNALDSLECTEHRLSSPCLHQETETVCDNNSKPLDQEAAAAPSVNEAEEEETSSNTDSIQTQVQDVNIRRSSSVPSKAGQNRDSSSSNDSGVSTGSLKQRGSDFVEFELPLTTAMSAKRHHHAVSQRLQQAAATTGCLHSSLPRRSKSSDPLRELTFQFQKIKMPAKSSSAEAEIPICPPKAGKGYSSPGESTIGGPAYMDSRSTSSGTSDMSDYIETLSLSSHSSSDTPESMRLMRTATTTLRPRSGKEYHNLDRSVLISDPKGLHQLRSSIPYANIAPVPEKSESPSPGYMSGTPPPQDQPEHFSYQKM